MSIFDTGDWEELDVGILGDGPALTAYIVTDQSMATHRRYRNRKTGEVVTSRL